MQRAKEKMEQYYAVAIGRQTGIFKTWGECHKQVIQFKGASFKKFQNLEEAEAFCGIVHEPADTESKKRKREDDADEEEAASKSLSGSVTPVACLATPYAM